MASAGTERSTNGFVDGIFEGVANAFATVWECELRAPDELVLRRIPKSGRSAAQLLPPGVQIFLETITCFHCHPGEPVWRRGVEFV